MKLEKFSRKTESQPEQASAGKDTILGIQIHREADVRTALVKVGGNFHVQMCRLCSSSRGEKGDAFDAVFFSFLFHSCFVPFFFFSISYITPVVALVFWIPKAKKKNTSYGGAQFLVFSDHEKQGIVFDRHKHP
jgi:hypothetical protein